MERGTRGNIYRYFQSLNYLGESTWAWRGRYVILINICVTITGHFFIYSLDQVYMRERKESERQQFRQRRGEVKIGGGEGKDSGGGKDRWIKVGEAKVEVG